LLNERKILNELHFGKGLLAQQLHQKAGGHEGLCGIPEVDKFQTVVDNYQIIVLSAIQPNREGQSVCQNFASVKNATKSCRTKKGSPKITCVQERCVAIAKRLLTQINNRCYMKTIVNQEEDSGEASSKRNGILEEMIGEEEKEEDTQGEEADNNKANNYDSKSVWYRFGSLTITIGRFVC